MTERFPWVPDVARGEWLRPLEAEAFGSITSIVPPGFEAYARVFHPVERDRPRATKTWRGTDRAAYLDDARDIAGSLETERATWAQAAASFGTVMHAQAQYARLVRRTDDGSDGTVAPDGWCYGDPAVGRLETASLAAAAAVLARHTATPDAGTAAVWEGWGGLTSSAGRAVFTMLPHGRSPASGADDAAPDGARLSPGEGTPASSPHRDAAAVPDPLPGGRPAVLGPNGARGVASTAGELPGPLDEPQPGTGLLSDDIAGGPRFGLHGDTGRHYVLFEAAASDFADAAWPGRAPWVDEVMWAQSPSILWPDDHAWVLATEIDFDSTLVAGTTALLRDLARTPGLEVLPIRPDADLSWDGDALNRPG